MKTSIMIDLDNFLFLDLFHYGYAFNTLTTMVAKLNNPVFQINFIYTLDISIFCVAGDYSIFYRIYQLY